MTRILQPSTSVASGADYVSSMPEHVFWGRLPCASDGYVGVVEPGGDIIIDTVSHEGLLPDQGGDPVAYFTAHGVPRDEILDDAAAIAHGLTRDPRLDGPHVVTGPIEVPGAHPGDMLAVTVANLERRVPYGVISTRHARGVMADVPDFDGDYGQFCRVDGDTAVFPLRGSGAQGKHDVAGGSIRFPLDPFLGIMGVTGAGEDRPSSVPPAEYGGNIDLNELTVGATLFLPVQVEGAGLYIGDPHFAQGNGEVSLTALEASLRATLHVELVHARDRRRYFGDEPMPLAYAGSHLIPMGIDRDLDRALQHCVRNAVEVLSHLFSVPSRQAYLLLSAAVDFNVTQAVDIVKGVHALIDTGMFRDCAGYGDAERFLHRFEDRSLLIALERYETALMHDNVDVMSTLFANDPDGIPVTRSDAAGTIIGHDAIGTFRTARKGAPDRTLRHRMIRMLAPDAASIVSEFRKTTGGIVTQTQVWKRIAGAWRIVEAHLTYPASAVDRRIWRVVGDPLVASTQTGPLHGLKVAVKDLFAIRGFATGVGNPVYLSQAPIERDNADAVERLLGSGADIRGIAQTDEFAYSLAGTNIHYGTPPNPYAPGRVSGGSSSGPASAVATGQADIGLGTDTAGSIRIPAAYQGLWGIRTSHGRISLRGVHPLSSSFDTVGVLARDPAVLAQAVGALTSDADIQRPDGTVLVGDALDACVQTDIRRAFARFRDDVKDTISVDEVPITPEMLDDWLDVFQIVRGYEAWQVDGTWVSEHADSLAPEIASRFEHDTHIGLDAYRQACSRLRSARMRIRALIGGHAIMIPTASSVAPLVHADAADSDAIERARAQTLRLTCIAGVGGLPAVNIPWETEEGLPCGVCVIGPAGSDRSLIEFAARLAHMSQPCVTTDRIA